MSDPAEFLVARLDEDGAAALFRRGGRPDLAAVVADADVTDLAAKLGDPARALREVAAKRAILAEYERLNAAYLAYRHGANQAAMLGLRTAVEFLCAAWSDHPDYEQEWKP